jgi:uncharacterized delta-60 repeat protein
VTTGLSLSVDFGRGLGLALAPDGRIVIAGNGPDGLLAARFYADGAPDPSFAGDGSVEAPVRDGGAARAVTVRPDGRILVAGHSKGPATKRTAVFVQFLDDGGLDRSFGDDGVVQRRFGRKGGATIAHVTLTPAAKILAVASRVNSDRERGVLARLRSNGSPDRSFSNDGVWKSKPAKRSKITVLNTVHRQPNGRILAAGTVRKAFLLRRFRASGEPDRSFSRNGRTTTGFGIGRAAIDELAMQQEGKLVAVGTRTILSGGGRSFTSDLAAAAYLLR